MEKNRFTICANNYIDCLRQEGRYSTAHVYKHAIRSFSQFCGTQSITFSKINRKTLKRYSNYLMASRLKPNTISTYMRMLRSIYNRGVLCTWLVPGCIYRGGHTSEESHPDR
jgi:integrase/recombinase XerD